MPVGDPLEASKYPEKKRRGHTPWRGLGGGKHRRSGR